ncbi:hypothetical protein TCAL_15936 [Tigriopus californicus]|uniref:Fibronectin type-II domain-containing protein n=1 Tax=Tigriopus californicus TaxID=6832 RepID=A0A553PH88_TIGCA|nr:hypothetical protein TCAL_15936 [Tigriopus californicus]
MSTVQSPHSAWNNGRAASSVTVAVDTFASSQTSPASSQYNTPARHSAVCPTNGPGRVLPGVERHAGRYPRGRTNARIETSPMDPLTSSAVDLGIQIGPNSRNSPTLLSQTAASRALRLADPVQKYRPGSRYIASHMGFFHLGLPFAEADDGPGEAGPVTYPNLQELHVKHILNQEEISRQFKQMRLRLTLKESSKAPKMWKPTTRSPSHIVPCSTENGVSCVFPFNYQGQNQTKCLKSLLPGKTWCPIKLQPDGTFIQQPDAWDYCRPGCS